MNLPMPVQGTPSVPCWTSGSALRSRARKAARPAGDSVAGVMSGISARQVAQLALGVEQAGFFLALGAVSQQFHVGVSGWVEDSE